MLGRAARCSVLLNPDPAAVKAAIASTVILTSVPPVAMLGQAVTLTALVSPAIAIGHVTFYDGSTVLGIAQITGGKAAFSTALLPSGKRQLKAYYAGDTANLPGTSASITEIIRSGAGTGFKSTVSYAASAFTKAVVVGDFNGDGKPDLATVAGGLLSLEPLQVDGREAVVFLGTGTGTFVPAPAYFGSQSLGLAVGDFNGDGRADLAMILTTARVDILLGQGDGTFRSAGMFSLSHGAAAGAVNSRPDRDRRFQSGWQVRNIAVLSSSSSDPSLGISVLLGNGDGISGLRFTTTGRLFPACAFGGRLQRRWRTRSGHR